MQTSLGIRNSQNFHSLKFAYTHVNMVLINSCKILWPRGKKYTTVIMLYVESKMFG